MTDLTNQNSKDFFDSLKKDQIDALPEPQLGIENDPGQGHSLDGENDEISIADYALAHGLSLDEVWQKLKRGELIGRTHKGQLYIIKGDLSGFKAREPFQDPDRSELPPVPEYSEGPETKGGMVRVLDPYQQRWSHHTETSLLLSHISHAKEENREIIAMTREAMRHVNKVTDQLLFMKDELLKTKDDEIETLKRLLLDKDNKIRKLSQDKEDLEILNKLLSAD